MLVFVILEKPTLLHEVFRVIVIKLVSVHACSWLLIGTRWYHFHIQWSGQCRVKSEDFEDLVALHRTLCIRWSNHLEKVAVLSRGRQPLLQFLSFHSSFSFNFFSFLLCRKSIKNQKKKGKNKKTPHATASQLHWRFLKKWLLWGKTSAFSNRQHILLRRLQ